MPTHSEPKIPYANLPTEEGKWDNIAKNILGKLPAFIYLLADDYTIRYANRFFNRQFGPAHVSSRCYSLMRRRKSACNPCPVQNVFKEQKEQVWIWEDSLRQHLYEVHDIPYSSEDGELLVLGLGINIEQRRKGKKPPEKLQRKEDFLRICCHCKNINDNNEEWERIEAYLGRKIDLQLSHGICPECLVKNYPQAAKKVGK